MVGLLGFVEKSLTKCISPICSFYSTFSQRSFHFLFINQANKIYTQEYFVQLICYFSCASVVLVVVLCVVVTFVVVATPIYNTFLWHVNSFQWKEKHFSFLRRQHRETIFSSFLLCFTSLNSLSLSHWMNLWSIIKTLNVVEIVRTKQGCYQQIYAWNALNIYKARGKANFSSFINKNNRWAKCVLHSALLWIVLHSILQTAAPRTALSSSSSSCTRLAYLTQFYHLSCKLNRTFHQHH